MIHRPTDKQRIIVKLILEAADAGEFITLAKLYPLMPYRCAYGSLRTSLKFLDRAGVITRERVGLFTLLRPTALAYRLYR